MQEHQKNTGQLSGAFVLVWLRLCRRVHGAGISASAAIDALVSVDHKLAIALGDRVHGAVGSARAAADALVGNNVCHGQSPPLHVARSTKVKTR